MGKNLEESLINILKEELVPAEGCTEPIAIAYVGAKARALMEKEPEKIKVYVSGNIIKNVKSVVVPNSGGMIGIEAAAVMGIVAGDPEKDLLVISSVDDKKLLEVNREIGKEKVEVINAKTDMKLYIRVELYNAKESVSVEVKHVHTNITKIIKNGEVLLNRACNDTNFNSPLKDRELLTIELILDMAKKIDIDLIKPILKRVIEFNSRIAQEGLKGTYGVNIGQIIQKNISEGIYGDDQRNRCASFTASGSDARMSGCPLPVITTSGSGNQGMTASLPIIKYCRDKNLPEEKLYRGLFFSHLATIHIKTNIGRLSAYCGVICASAAVSGAIAFLEKGSYETVAGAVTNTLGNISGVVCDGAKASCAMKIATGITAAFDSAMLALNSRILSSGEGIVGESIEDTIKNIGDLSQNGMAVTDEVILDIMVR